LAPRVICECNDLASALRVAKGIAEVKLIGGRS
jgi:hypothetical protein